MGNIVFNVSKGKVVSLAALPATNDALIAVVVEAAGIESDATLADYDTLAALLAGASNEQTTMGRKTLAGVTVGVDDTNNRAFVDADDLVWAAAAGSDTAALIVCYDPDTTTGTDADLVPLVRLDFAVTPGGEVTYQVATDGFFHAS